MPVTTGYSVASIAALKALPTVDLIDGYSRSVDTKRSWYFYISTATATADDDLIVTPNSSVGRWYSNKIVDLSSRAALVHSHVPSDITNLDEYIQDLLNTSLVGGSGISLVYSDIANTLTINAGGSGATGFIAATINYTSPTLAPGSVSTQSITSDVLFTVLKCSTTYPARVRIYSTNAFASVDSTRPITSTPTGNHGCQFDLVTTNVYQTLELVPPVQIYTTETPAKIYISVTNLDNTNRAIPVVLDIYKW